MGSEDLRVDGGIGGGSRSVVWQSWSLKFSLCSITKVGKDL